MSKLLDKFAQFHGRGTKQIGRLFCIPASLANALRLLDVDGVTQEAIRDAWYQDEGRNVEPNVNDQMDGAGFGIVAALERRTLFLRGIGKEMFTRPGDCDAADLTRADEALQFIRSHLSADHPVIVSTWNRILGSQSIEIHGFHMWLLLDADWAANEAVIHDAGKDSIGAVSISNVQNVNVGGRIVPLDLGLRGCITHSDYTCLALWKESQ